MDLVVVDPAGPSSEGSLGKRCLSYCIEITATPVDLSTSMVDLPPPPPPAEGDSGGGRGRLDRRGGPCPAGPSGSPTSGGGAGAMRRLVHTRLGLLPHQAGYVAAAELSPGTQGSPRTRIVAASVLGLGANELAPVDRDTHCPSPDGNPTREISAGSMVPSMLEVGPIEDS
jgi:hypothetical protein